MEKRKIEIMKKPVPVTIFYSHPYHGEEYINFCSFQMTTELLFENIPFVGDSFHLEGLFSKIEIEKELIRILKPDYGVIDLVLVKDRLIKYKNSEIDCIGLCVTKYSI